MVGPFIVEVIVKRKQFETIAREQTHAESATGSDRHSRIMASSSAWTT